MRSLAWIIVIALAGCNKQPASSPSQPQQGVEPSATAAQPQATTPPAAQAQAPAQPQPPAGPVETLPPNAPDQKPAFEGQTRAPLKTANVQFDVQTVAKGLAKPWALAFLPDGRMLVTEKPGRLNVVTADGKVTQVKGVPKVDGRD